MAFGHLIQWSSLKEMFWPQILFEFFVINAFMNLRETFMKSILPRRQKADKLNCEETAL